MDEMSLPELTNNPFVSVLGKPPDRIERFDLMNRPAPYDASERTLSHDERKYAVLRLFEVSVPIRSQVDLVERVNMAIRQGYKARDPARGWHRAQFLASSSALSAIVSSRKQRSKGSIASRAWEDDDPIGNAVAAVRENLPVLKNAGGNGFALLGLPGLGKSTSTGVILDAIPQVIEQRIGYYVKQLVWVKIDCPPAPTRRQFCQAAFQAMDLALGTDYIGDFYDTRGSNEDLVFRLQNLVVVHAVGLFVIDEIQNVAFAAERPETFLNFFVNLVNRLGVPLMLIGTAEASPLLNAAFRLARRASGLGQPNWDRLQIGEEWDDWLTEMWRYQWTAEPTPLTPEISEAIYHESQGIVDIAVKLLMLAQMRAISRGEVGYSEALDAGLFHTIAKEEFALAKPLLDAVREGRMDVLEKVPDLVPFHIQIDKVLSGAIGMTAQEFRDLRESRREALEAARAGRSDPLAELRASIQKRGYSPEIVDRVLSEALKGVATDDLLGLSVAIATLLENLPKTKEKTGGRKPVVTPEPATLTETGPQGDEAVDAWRASGMLVSSVEDILGKE